MLRRNLTILSCYVGIAASTAACAILIAQPAGATSCTQACGPNTSICNGTNTSCIDAACVHRPGDTCVGTKKTWLNPITRGSTTGSIMISFMSVDCYTTAPCTETPIAGQSCIINCVPDDPPQLTCKQCGVGASTTQQVSTCVGNGCNEG